MKIAIAGASGFVGQLLLEGLSKEFDLIALGRSVPRHPLGEGQREITWRNCDLFSLLQIENALKGADIAIYLVHSMLPRARLTQSSFEDCDLLLADNFARGAKIAGLQRIIYLSGLIPEGPGLSKHLRSRKEVERVLSSQGTPVTTLRAGLILGAQGSSFQMLYLLVKRLPVMICPSWTQTRTQCIAAPEVVDLIRFCILDSRTIGRTFDIGSPEVLNYQGLMAMLAEVMGKHRRFFSIRYFTPGLSRLWVQLITGASRNLVSPLVQSLKHEMIVRDPSLLEMYGKPLMGMREALKKCLVNIKPTLRSSTRQRSQQLRGDSEVRSIQRLPLPEGRTAAWIADEYFKWLPSFFSPLILVHKTDEENVWVFRFAFLKLPLLKLWHSRLRSTEDRHLFYIRGGILAKKDQPSARLEFREVLNGEASIAAIHEFKPSLPWPIYKYSQAIIHLWVMNSFRKHLSSKH
jgi:uncharacterized protein YbjT (DUF2867 family)